MDNIEASSSVTKDRVGLAKVPDKRRRVAPESITKEAVAATHAGNKSWLLLDPDPTNNKRKKTQPTDVKKVHRRRPDMEAESDYDPDAEEAQNAGDDIDELIQEATARDLSDDDRDGGGSHIIDKRTGRKVSPEENDFYAFLVVGLSRTVSVGLAKKYKAVREAKIKGGRALTVKEDVVAIETEDSAYYESIRQETMKLAWETICAGDTGVTRQLGTAVIYCASMKELPVTDIGKTIGVCAFSRKQFPVRELTQLEFLVPKTKKAHEIDSDLKPAKDEPDHITMKFFVNAIHVPLIIALYTLQHFKEETAAAYFDWLNEEVASEGEPGTVVKVDHYKKIYQFCSDTSAVNTFWLRFCKLERWIRGELGIFQRG